MESRTVRQLLFWGCALIAFGLLIALLRDVLLPFVLGLILAYFLDPLAVALERKGFSRVAATGFIFAVFTLLGVLFLLLVGPVLVSQISELARQVPAYLAHLQEIVVSGSDSWLGRFLPGGEAGARDAMQNLSRQMSGELAGVLTSLLSGSMALFNFVSLLLITPVVTFFLLKDWNALVARVNEWLPRDHAPVIRLLAKRMDRSIDAFIRGQVTISLFLGIFYAVALTLSGLKYGLLIGLTGGILNIVPFLGSLTGLVISTTMAVVQYWPQWQPIAIVVAIFLFGQLVDANFLTPKIIGDKIRLHPVWIIFALIAAGYLFGLVGMLIAIPLAAAIGVLVRYGLERYLGSSLYLGSRGRDGDQKA